MSIENRYALKRYSNRLALITGATSGLGKALATTSSGYDLIVSGRSDAAPPAAHTIRADLALKDDRKKLIEAIHSYVPDLVINNAGYGLYGDAISYTAQDQLDILEVNANAVLELTLEAAQALKAANKGGIILNVASAAAFFPMPGMAVYAAAKACVRSFSKALDFELKPHGIRVLVFCPGQIDTHFRLRAAQGQPQHPDRLTMPVEKAAEAIWRQIEQQKPEVVFDWRYRLGVFLGRFVPCNWWTRRSYENIASRISKN